MIVQNTEQNLKFKVRPNEILKAKWESSFPSLFAQNEVPMKLTFQTRSHCNSLHCICIENVLKFLKDPIKLIGFIHFGWRNHPNSI